MAIIFCRNCGKQVTDRMEKCPHCHAVLIEKAEKPVVTKEQIKASTKHSIAGVVTATILLIAVLRIWSAIAAIYIANMFGDYALAAIGYSSGAFYKSTFVLLIIEAVLFCILPVLLKKTTLNQFVMAMVLSVLFAIAGWAVQHHAVLQYARVSPELMHYSRFLSVGFGAAFPLFWGSLAVSVYNRTFKRTLIMQGVLAILFLVLSVFFDVLMIGLFGMGIPAFSYGNLLSAFFVFGLAVFTNKGFHHLITPKNLA